MSKSQPSKHETTSQHLQDQQSQNQHAREEQIEEKHASANASAGINLNLIGALSGALSSKSKKTTHQNADGSSTSVKDRDDKAAASGYAQGNGAAYAQGSADKVSRKSDTREVGQSASQAKKVEGKKKMDHLGIEA